MAVQSSYYQQAYNPRKQTETKEQDDGHLDVPFISDNFDEGSPEYDTFVQEVEDQGF